MDPASLDTLGENSLNGQLATPALAAHYRVMPGQQQLQQQQVLDGPGGSSSSSGAANGGRSWVGFSFNVGLPAELLFYELGGEQIISSAKFELSIHYRCI